MIISNNNLHANFSTLYLAVFKELRLNLNLNQAVIANFIGKTPSAWTKIENGQTQLSFDTFLGACRSINYQPAYLLSMVEKLTYFFNQKGYYFFYGNDDEDLLLSLIVEFYNSKGLTNIRNLSYSNNYRFISIFAFNNYDIVPTIVEYCTNQEFKKWLDNGANEQEFSHSFITPSSFTTPMPFTTAPLFLTPNT